MNSSLFYDDNYRFQNLNVYDCVTKTTMLISACIFGECRVWSVGQLVYSCLKLDNVLLLVFTVETSCYVKIVNHSPWAMYYCWSRFLFFFCEPVFCWMYDYYKSYYYTGLKGFQIENKCKICVFVSFKTQIIYRIKCRIKTRTV